MFEQIVEFGLKSGIAFGALIFRFQIKDQRHQRFGDIPPAELAEMAALVRLIAKGVGRGGVHSGTSACHARASLSSRQRPVAAAQR
jgi:hypothetical protein